MMEERKSTSARRAGATAASTRISRTRRKCAIRFESLPGAPQHPWPGAHLWHQPSDDCQLDKKAKNLLSLSEKLLPTQSGGLYAVSYGT